MVDRLYTAAEAADYLRVKPRTVVVWANARKIGCVRTGPKSRIVRFTQAHLDAWVEANTLNAKG